MGIKDIKTREEFDLELRADGDRFMFFYSAWCPFCSVFAPTFEKFAASAPGAFAKVSSDSLPELEDAFCVDVVPTVLCFRAGRLHKRLDGALGRGLTEKGLRDFIKACAVTGRGK
jgi:thioredoxin-like negative regulator of GroEL